MRDTAYAREIASANIGGHCIEKIYVKAQNQEEIRFSWWKGGKFAPRPLDLPEDELLRLFDLSIKNGVFSNNFLNALLSAMNSAKNSGKF